LDGDLGIFEVNATMETDNIAALKMYRRMGFKEDYNYPHVYLTQEALQRVKIGQWCQ
jgi:ribosomal protein S18 acetylase RimI-like enzyme